MDALLDTRRIEVRKGLFALGLAVIVLAGCQPSPQPMPTSTPIPPIATPVPPTPTPVLPIGDGVVDGWAVLVEKDDYSDVEMSDLLTDFINIIRFHQLLLGSGWQESHIRELRDSFRQAEMRQALSWLAANADGDDVVLFYVAAHGRFLHEVVHWGDFFDADWEAVPSPRRVLVVDACHAGAFTSTVNDDPQAHLSIAAVDALEHGWSGLPEEGLPILGGVFTHYFTAAFTDPEADTDGDGTVSCQEAARHTEGQQRSYMHDVVFAVPEFVEMFHEIGVYPEEDPGYPHVLVDDAVDEPLYLELDAYP